MRLLKAKEVREQAKNIDKKEAEQRIYTEAKMFIDTVLVDVIQYFANMGRMGFVFHRHEYTDLAREVQVKIIEILNQYGYDTKYSSHEDLIVRW